MCRPIRKQNALEFGLAHYNILEYFKCNALYRREMYATAKTAIKAVFTWTNLAEKNSPYLNIQKLLMCTEI